ncbi:WbqC family protein [Paralcaligenes sp. KSB-10]|uniref:WbqC family protein n=1 Tax=Paralcaligenes sp. KSB-10 TaxID=2901142 RepID=UPI001E36C4A5|nr:WbqC family protein [Paralcaligenes sp. KSB-10]UHL65278.1 WbqC family protein [Paralcaligenes sp. KSB-10]
MKIGIMQPYFFPYLGHFALIANVDRWLVFDITQYTPKTWMNRNRILHPAGGSQYVTVALANSSISIKTCEARILDKEASRQAVLGKLTHYRRYAPYYGSVIALVDQVFSSSMSDSLVALNVSGLKATCDYLCIPFAFDTCSAMGLNLPSGLRPGGWAPEICEAINATEYINPIGGRHLFSSEDFLQKKIKLSFLDFQGFSYPVGNYSFEPNLSILDVLMWNSPEIVKNYIDGAAKIIPAEEVPGSLPNGI